MGGNRMKTKMAGKGIGNLIVVENEKPVGILTERIPSDRYIAILINLKEEKSKTFVPHFIFLIFKIIEQGKLSNVLYFTLLPVQDNVHRLQLQMLYYQAGVF
ncbi:MAG: hypothetical protein WAM14_02410 [Candidatus Nitrosopolaris sp.]